MSSLAEVFVVRTEDLGELVDAARPRRRLLGRAPDTFDAVLAERARDSAALPVSGHVVGVLLEYLEERSPWLLDDHHEHAEFTELEDPGAGRAMRDALAFLHQRMATLGEGSVLLLRVG